MTSLAPYSKAFMAASVPLVVRDEMTTTGMGLCAMILRKKVSPSMRGISMSNVMTSGTSFMIFLTAIMGSAAVPMTSISGSASRIAERD